MSLFAGFNPVQVIERIDWTPEQFSLRVSGVELPFSAGQFTKLGLEDDAGNLRAEPILWLMRQGLQRMNMNF